MGSDAASTVSAVWRLESARLVAGLEQWPRDGIPRNPGAWLMSVARRRAVDHFRRADTLRRRTAELGQELEEAEVPDLAAAVDHSEDDVLRLMFRACHPALPDLAIVGPHEQGRPLPDGYYDAVRVPALVIAGGKSPEYMRNAQAAIADALPDGRLEVAPGQTHMVKPKVVAPQVTEFLAG